MRSKNYLKNFCAPRTKFRFFRPAWAGRRLRAGGRAGGLGGLAAWRCVLRFFAYMARLAIASLRLRLMLARSLLMLRLTLYSLKVLAKSFFAYRLVRLRFA